jgi:4-hydroxy-tetrahydrodipicolinate reductase
MTKIIINGCNGRMGRTIIGLAGESDRITVVAGVDPQPPENDAFPFPVYSRLADVVETGDVVIDFSRPDGVDELIDYCIGTDTAAVIATTGYSGDQQNRVTAAARQIAVLQSANMSLGINILKRLIVDATAVLGTTFDVEIVERHHKMKKDAPSGTALLLGEAVRSTIDERREFVHGRHGGDTMRQAWEIGVHAVRGGTIVGEHDVHFVGNNEELILGHKAYSRALFAGGALKAAEYLALKAPGLYSMEDLVAESTSVTRIYTGRESLITFPRISGDPAVAFDIFNAFGEADIRIDMISQTVLGKNSHSLSFSIGDDDQAKSEVILRSLRETGDIEGEMTSGLTKITVEGIGMERLSGVASKIFGILRDLQIESQAVTTSETTITWLVDHAVADSVIAGIKTTYDM